MNDLKNLLATIHKSGHTIDIILLCETFIHELNKKHCYIEGYNLEELHRSKKSKGEVAIYINKNIKYITEPI